VYRWLHGGLFPGACKASGNVWLCPVTGPGIGNGVIAWTTQWTGEETGSKLPGKYQFVHTLDGETLRFRANEKMVDFRPRLFNNSK
jgi:hypothetical protein